MNKMKSSFVLLLVMAALWSMGSTCSAEIIPPYGPGQIGLSSVVLCDSLTMRKEPDSASAVVEMLHYGDRIIVMNQKDGWANCVLGDSEDSPSGWVNSDYIVIDPSWYRTDAKTIVFAWNDAKALKVAQLDKDTTLPVLKDQGDWLIVSLRGATGWIQKNDADKTDAKSESKATTDEQSEKTSDQDNWFTVYARDGSTASIHQVSDAMWEDAKGRTYVNTDGSLYYCITTDVTYASDPSVWDYIDENETGDEDEWTGEDYGENQDYED